MKVVLTFFALFCSLLAYSQNNASVRGKITEKETGQPAIGVSVMVKGTTNGTMTTLDGDYELSNVPSDAILVISSIGKGTQEIPVAGKSIINAEIADDTQLLDQVVIIGFGTTTVKDLTAPITVIKAEELARQTVSNPVQALQGKVAGVMISSSGVPGATPSIRIRGVGTVESNASPLYVVDDMFVNNIDFLSSNDIESMTILKDASSAAIYGVRAANGVILITTKKGAKIEQEPTVNYNGSVGVQTITQKFRLANAAQYITLIHEKQLINGIRPDSLLDFSRYTGDTDWLDEVLQAAMIHTHEVNLSGNTGKSNYFVGLSYLNQDGILKNSGFQRINMRAAHDISVGKYVKTGYSINLSYITSDNPYNSALGSAFYTPPVIRVRNEDGSFGDPTSLTSVANPVAALQYNSFDKTRGLKYLPSAYIEVKPIEDLKFRSTFTLDGGNTRNKVFTPVYRVSSAQQNEISAFRQRDDAYLNYTFDNTLTYTRNIDKHRFSAMGGLSLIHFSSNWIEASIRDIAFLDEASLYFKNGDKNTINILDDGSKIRSLSYFGRLFYGYDNKYLVTATLRRDGSSTFPKDNRWATAPSLGLGWVLSEESFMQDVKVIDFLKLRVSWGILGNNNVPQNAYTTVVNREGNLSAVFGPFGSTNISQGANITTVVAPNLKWETVREYDLGVEVRLLNNRLDFEADYYHRLTRDAIFPFPLMGINGTTTGSVLKNNADILNSGFEFNVLWSDKLNDDFSYTVSLNTAFNRNKVARLNDGTIPFFSGAGINGSQAAYTQLGEPVGAFYVYDVIGVFQDNNDILNYKSSNGTIIQPNAKPGDFKYADMNDDGILDNNNDRKVVGSYMPKVVYGFNIGFTYKSFDFSMDIQGVLGNKIYNFKRIQRFGNENYDRNFYENRWHGAGTSNTNPSSDVSGRQNSLPSTFWVESGSYLRFRNIQVGYNFAPEVAQKMKMTHLRVFFTAQNPLTIFGYNGLTPEISGETNGSNVRATEQGFDNQIYPLSSIFSFGLNIKF